MRLTNELFARLEGELAFRTDQLGESTAPCGITLRRIVLCLTNELFARLEGELAFRTDQLGESTAVLSDHFEEDRFPFDQ